MKDDLSFKLLAATIFAGLIISFALPARQTPLGGQNDAPSLASQPAVTSSQDRPN